MAEAMDKTCHPMGGPHLPGCRNEETPIVGGDRRFGGYLYDTEPSERARD